MAAKRIPLVGSMNTRGVDAGITYTTYDQLYQNVMFVPVKDEVQKTLRVYVEKRPGWSSGSAVTNLTTIAASLWWVGANSGADATALGGVQAAGTNAQMLVDGAIVKTHANSSQITFITNMFNSAGTPLLVWQRANSEVWGYPYGGATAQITVASGIVGRMVEMDGWTFHGTGQPARIYNSNLNDPTAGYTNYISCDTQADRLLTAWRHDRFILGFGTNSIDWFYNAGNPSGSPLSRVTGVDLQYSRTGIYAVSGALAGYPIDVGFGSTWFISQGEACGVSLHRITGAKLEKIENPIIERILTSTQLTLAVKCVTVAGIQLVIVLGDIGTFVYFPQTGLWSYWTSPQGLAWNTILQGAALKQTRLSVFDQTTNTTYGFNIGVPVYQDGGSNYTRLIRTSVHDFGTGKYKYDDEGGVRLVGDRAAATANVSIRYTDDDYATWSTVRTIDMSQASQKLSRNGRFTRRAWEISDTLSTNVRLEALSVDVKAGAT